MVFSSLIKRLKSYSNNNLLEWQKLIPILKFYGDPQEMSGTLSTRSAWEDV